jgi:hypothetical protein
LFSTGSRKLDQFTTSSLAATDASLNGAHEYEHEQTRRARRHHEARLPLIVQISNAARAHWYACPTIKSSPRAAPKSPLAAAVGVCKSTPSAPKPSLALAATPPPPPTPPPPLPPAATDDDDAAVDAAAVFTATLDDVPKQEYTHKLKQWTIMRRQVYIIVLIIPFNCCD